MKVKYVFLIGLILSFSLAQANYIQYSNASNLHARFVLHQDSAACIPHQSSATTNVGPHSSNSHAFAECADNLNVRVYIVDAKSGKPHDRQICFFTVNYDGGLTISGNNNLCKATTDHDNGDITILSGASLQPKGE